MVYFYNITLVRGVPLSTWYYVVCTLSCSFDLVLNSLLCNVGFLDNFFLLAKDQSFTEMLNVNICVTIKHMKVNQLFPYIK